MMQPVKRCIVFSFHNHKGGVGKTTLARETATKFALEGYRTLLMDCDQQGTLTHSVRVRRYGDLRRLVLDGDVQLRRVPDRFTGVEGLDFQLLASNWSTKEIENHALTVPNLYQAMDILRDNFDIIIADMAPSIDDIHSAMFFASDYIIIPTLNTAYSINAIGDTLEAMATHDEQFKEYGLRCGQALGVVPIAFEANTSIKRRIRGKMYTNYKMRVPILPEMRRLDIWEAAADMRRSIWSLTSTNPFEVDAINRAQSDMMPLINAMIQAMELAA